jgi:chromosome segregation ATPase
VSSINPAPIPNPPQQPQYPVTLPPQSNGLGTKIWVLFGLVIALVGANVYLYTQLNGTKADLNKTRDALISEIDKVREASSLSAQSHRRNVESLKDQLEAAKRQASMAAGQARVDAIKKSEELTAQLAKEQQKQGQALKADISKVEESATTANSKIGEVSTEVGTVKTDVASTKTELEKTIANLKRATGDISSQGSLIATNAQELSALKALGERNYVEFRLNKSKEMQKVGDVSVQLKKADMKKNRYTIELLVDDKRVEKKDKTINEPVQFLTSKARQPYEIVVNEVKKDQIAGYLATPKVQSVRNEHHSLFFGGRNRRPRHIFPPRFYM